MSGCKLSGVSSSYKGTNPIMRVPPLMTSSKLHHLLKALCQMPSHCRVGSQYMNLGQGHTNLQPIKELYCWEDCRMEGANECKEHGTV